MLTLGTIDLRDGLPETVVDIDDNGYFYIKQGDDWVALPLTCMSALVEILNTTMSEQSDYAIPADLMNEIYRTLQDYANPGVYRAPRTGGVLAGCARGQRPKPEQLSVPAKIVLRRIDRDILGRTE